MDSMIEACTKKVKRINKILKQERLHIEYDVENDLYWLLQDGSYCLQSSHANRVDDMFTLLRGYEAAVQHA